MMRLSWLGSKYGSYISQKGGKPPKTIKDLKEFVAQTTTPEQLARLGVTDVETLFISTRDGKPFGLAHRSKMPPPGVGAPPIVLYEVTGERGWRAVAYLGGGTATVDERELPQLLPPPPTRAR